MACDLERPLKEKCFYLLVKKKKALGSKEGVET